MINPYQSSVSSFTDEELKQFSSEIEEAYRFVDSEGDYDWYTGEEADAAASRHAEIEQEIDRRWVLANPEAAKRRDEGRKFFLQNPGREILSALSRNLAFASTIRREYDQKFSPKVGDTVAVRMPRRFTT